jgi:type VI secretion system secreted protein Hcp
MPDIFLKLTGIKGESTDAKHPDEIVIESFSFGEASDLNSDTGQRSGRVAMQDYHFVMTTNAASAPLMLKCADGSLITEGLLTLRKPGATQFEYLKIKFSDILVSSFQTSGLEVNPITTDQFSLWFAKVDLQYFQQKADGTLGLTFSFRWDRTRGVAF